MLGMTYWTVNPFIFGQQFWKYPWNKYMCVLIAFFMVTKQLPMCNISVTDSALQRLLIFEVWMIATDCK